MSDFATAGWATESWKPNTSKLAVFFHRVQKKNEFQSEKQGRPVFMEEINIVKIPADQFLRIDRKATKEDLEEFRAEYEHFLKTGESRVLGTPIEMWHAVSEIQKAEFKAVGIQTIEQVANLTDAALQKWMGGAELRQKARVFIESGKDAELVAKIKAEANAEIEAMKAQMAEMRAMLEAATAPAGKK
jgi:hypothetical protein